MNDQSLRSIQGRCPDSRLSWLLTKPGAPSQGRVPLVLFLHSLEERGLGLDRLLDNPGGQGKGLAHFALEQEATPWYTLSPLCPGKSAWSWLHGPLTSLLARMIESYPIDPSRVFLTGVSMGGMGTWSLAAHRPRLFRAIAPISAGFYFPWIRLNHKALMTMPVMAFHDARDPSIPLHREAPQVRKLWEMNPQVQYRISHTGRHYIHEDIYRAGWEPRGLFHWFLSHKELSRHLWPSPFPR